MIPTHAYAVSVLQNVDVPVSYACACTKDGNACKCGDKYVPPIFIEYQWINQGVTVASAATAVKLLVSLPRL